MIGSRSALASEQAWSQSAIRDDREGRGQVPRVTLCS